MEVPNAAHFTQAGPQLDPTKTWAQRFAVALDRDQRLHRDQAGVRLFAVEPAGRFVGAISLNNLVRGIFLCADLGYRIRHEVQGFGYGFEACSAVLDFAVAPAPAGLGLHRVQCNVAPANERSLGLAARLGFRREGFALKMLQLNGTWTDHVMHAKLAEEHHASATPKGAGTGGH